MDKTNPIRKYYVVPIVIAIVSIIVFSQIWKLLLVRFFPYLLCHFSIFFWSMQKMHILICFF